MPKVSVNILSKNRLELLKKAIDSVLKQSYSDFEILVVNDGSTDGTENFLQSDKNIQAINHKQSMGITRSRQEALEASAGEYITILDDDDEWIDVEKLKKQVEFLESHPDYSLVGGGIKIELGSMNYELRTRPRSDAEIRSQMLLKNPFFTSTVMFRKSAAIEAGGFNKDEIDLAEDYDLWLRLGKLGKMYNFQEPFTLYAKPHYNKEKFKLFLKKQLNLIQQHRKNYKHYWLASLILRFRIFCI